KAAPACHPQYEFRFADTSSPPRTGCLVTTLPSRSVLRPAAVLPRAYRWLRYNFNWIDIPIFRNGTGAAQIPLHKRGVTGVPGLLSLGLPWLHKFKSEHLNGVGEDAEYLAEQMSRSIPQSTQASNRR